MFIVNLNLFLYSSHSGGEDYGRPVGSAREKRFMPEAYRNLCLDCCRIILYYFANIVQSLNLSKTVLGRQYLPKTDIRVIFLCPTKV